MVDALLFVGGDEVVEPFLLEGTDGDIIDLTTVTLSAGVWWRERLRIPLSVGAEIKIDNDHPPRNESAQVPHGTLTLTEAQTVLIPKGQIASLRVVAIRTVDQITLSTYLMPLERIL